MVRAHQGGLAPVPHRTRSLQVAIPGQIIDIRLGRNGGFHPIGELHGRLLAAPPQGLHVPDVAADAPGADHHDHVAQHRVPAAVPKGLAKAPIVADGHRIDDVADREAALLELHHGRVVDAGALREEQDGRTVRGAAVLAQDHAQGLAIAQLPPVEPHLGGDPGEGALEHAHDAVVDLAGHRVVGIGHEHQDVQGTRVVAHTDAHHRPVLGVVEAPYDGQAAGHDAETLAQHALGQQPLQAALGQLAQHDRDEAGEEEAGPGGDRPEGQQQHVPNDPAQEPEEPQAPAEVESSLAEIAREQVPLVARTWGGHEQRRHLVLEDHFQAKPDQVAHLLHSSDESVLDFRRRQSPMGTVAHGAKIGGGLLALLAPLTL